MTTTKADIERIARAITKRLEQGNFACEGGMWEALACAAYLEALRAIREPSEEMLRAAVWALDAARERDGKLQDPRAYTAHEKHRIRHQAMIDQRIKEVESDS